MVQAKFAGINKVSKRLANGSIRYYYYHRATGRRLEGIPGTSEFAISYGDAERIVVERNEKNEKLFCSIIRHYINSPEFKRLAASTQQEYARILTKIEDFFWDLPIASLEDFRIKQDFLRWRADVVSESGPREADNRLSIASATLTWACNNGYISINHIKGFKRLYHSNRSEKIWLPEQIQSFIKIAPVELQRAMLLALHTGQRQGDLLNLTWNNYQDGWIVHRPSKNQKNGVPGRQVHIPCTTVLRNMLDSMSRVNAVILTTKTGLPLEGTPFQEAMGAFCKACRYT